MCTYPINYSNFQSACNISVEVAEKFPFDSTSQALEISFERNLRTEAYMFRT